VAGTSAVGATTCAFGYDVTGVSATGSVGSVTTSSGVTQNVTGVSATRESGNTVCLE